jgi:hypothetical protein
MYILFVNINMFFTSQHVPLAGLVARMGDWTGEFRVLVRKPEGKRPLGRPRHRWEDSIKMDL